MLCIKVVTLLLSGQKKSELIWHFVITIINMTKCIIFNIKQLVDWSVQSCFRRSNAVIMEDSIPVLRWDPSVWSLHSSREQIHKIMWVKVLQQPEVIYSRPLTGVCYIHTADLAQKQIYDKCSVAGSAEEPAALSRLFLIVVYKWNTHFNGVEWVSGEDEANPSKPSSEEVLQGTDRPLLFWHFYSPLCWNKQKHSTAATELNSHRK